MGKLPPQKSEIEAEARKIFDQENTGIADRDRSDYLSFDRMPLGLQQWWKQRAERRLMVNLPIDSYKMKTLRRS